MVVLVTGGTAYLGRRLVDSLVGQGITVRLTIQPGTRSIDVPNQVQVIVVDLCNPEDTVAAMEGVDRVYHLAFRTQPYHPEGDKKFLAVNRDGTRNLVQAARLAGVQRMVCCLPCLALGPPPDGVESFGAITEESYPWREHSGFLSEGGPFVRSLRATDHFLNRFAGDDIIRVYPAMVYGPSFNPSDNATNYYHELTAFIQRTVESGCTSVAAPLTHLFSTAYIDDVLHGLSAAMEYGRPGEKYILGGEETDWSALIHIIEELLDRKISITKPSKWFRPLLDKAKQLAHSLEYSASGRQEWSAIIRRDWRFSSQKAIAELDYTRTPIKLGVRRTLEWLGYLPADPFRREGSP